MLLEPYYLSTSQFMWVFKNKNILTIFDRHSNLKYNYGNLVHRILFKYSKKIHKKSIIRILVND